MAYRIGICGLANSGKSFGRRKIPDGENVFILQPSVKAAHLLGSDTLARKWFDIKSDKVSSLKDAISKANKQNVHQLIHHFNQNLPIGTIKKEHIIGNIQTIKDVALLPHWLEFIDKHMPWIHTVILPDFTHFISEVISRKEFIDRKAGGEAFNRFWELAGEALRNFILSIDNYRENLLVVTEFHTEYIMETGIEELFTPAGKMLNEKFKPESYYDVMLFTSPIIEEDPDTGIVSKAEYRFVTEKTKRYPYARSLNMFPGKTFIPNDLQLVLTETRKMLNIPI